MLWKKLLVAVLWCFCAELAYSVQPYVFGRMDLATGRIPSAIAASDFNRDGATDFAVVNTADNTVSVFLGKSDHTFTRTDYAVGSGPDSIAVADFNSDGHPDLVVANQNCVNNICGPGSVSILINKGDGTFLNSVSYGTGMTDAVAVVVADFNSDGQPDLAVANATYGYAGPGTVSIFLNQGNGTFRHKGDYPAGVGIGGLVAFAPGGNGSPSLAVTNFTALNGVNAIVILRGAGDGSFTGPVNSYPTGLGPIAIVSGDLNGDGNPDLAVANGAGNTVSVFLGRPDGTFANKVDLPVAFGPNRVTVGDLNGDHKIDLIVSAATSEPGGGAVSVLLGNGDGTFQPYVQYITGNDPISIVAADFNGDGYPDVAFTNGDVARVSILLGKGDGRFPTATKISTGSLPIAIAGADVNGDGRSDLIVANSGDNTISVFLNNGGIFALAHTYSVGREPKGIAVADFNGDHKPDLIVTNSGDNTISILLGNGDGSFAFAHTYSVGVAPYGVAVSDLNGDRMPDVVVANTGDDTISVLLGNGDGTLQPQTTYLVGAGPSSVAIADFNGDGMPDLAVSDSETPIKIGNPGLVSVLLNKGNGTFGNKTDYAAGYNPQSVVAVDLNGDGKPDLALATNLDTFGFVAVLIGNGDGTFQPQTTYQEGFAIYYLAAGDFNSDGFTDLVVTSSQNSAVFIMAGDGHGRFHVQGTYGTGEAPVSLAVGNFIPKTQPSGPDLAIANFYSNSISLFNNSQSQPHLAWTGAPDYGSSFEHPEE